MEKKDLKSLSYQEMLDEMAAMGEKTFRGKQIYQWLHEKLVSTPDGMPFLCVYPGWTDQKSSDRGDPGSGLSDSEIQWREGI